MAGVATEAVEEAMEAGLEGFPEVMVAAQWGEVAEEVKVAATVTMVAARRAREAVPEETRRERKVVVGVAACQAAHWVWVTVFQALAPRVAASREAARTARVASEG